MSKNVPIYKIMVGIPKLGIERSLPYLIYDEVAAQDVCDALNRLLGPEYTHRVETTGVIIERKTNGFRSKV